MKLPLFLNAMLVVLVTSCATIDVTPEIRGTVVDGESERPISGATAEARNPTVPRAALSAKTRSDGRFKIPPARDTKFMMNAALIEADVFIQAPGYEPRTFSAVNSNPNNNAPFVDLGVVPLKPKR